jgi:signal transduction histidine kinase
VKVRIVGEDGEPAPEVVRRFLTRRHEVDRAAQTPRMGSPEASKGRETDEVREEAIWIADPEGPDSAGEAARVIYLEVDEDAVAGRRMLVVSDELGEAAQIPIPTQPTMRIFHDTLSRSLAASAVLLLAGLGMSAVVSRRLARPLQALAARAEALGRGGAGVRIPVTSSGEVGELEAAFDRMSSQLAGLERERERWRQREHLAQLGDLSRGLAHTIRNPLNTLGLAVEELAGEGDDPRVTTARNQIQRIDRWIRSFLALGAGDAATAEECDLVELVQECLLEVGGDGTRLEISQPAVPVRAVASGLRAALGNLLENAVQASPAGRPPAITIAERDDGGAIVTIRDHGPGLPESVRKRLFEPHQTTRPEGAGMGLFLARQLVVGMHGGELNIADADGGGTIVTVTIPGEAAP